MSQRIRTPVALAAIVSTTMLGVIAGIFVDEFYSTPPIALCMIVWTVVGKALAGWRAVIIGLTALVAAFAGAIDAFVFAFLWAVLAGIIVIFPTNINKVQYYKE